MLTGSTLGGVLGIAIQASEEAAVLGGICETRAVGGRALNVGVSGATSRSGHLVSMWQAVLSTAHEVSVQERQC